MRNKLLIFLLAMVTALETMAQDPQFTQFYASPMFLNPAFTGLTYEHRFTANYRNQWPGIKKAFSTYMATYDYNISNLNINGLFNYSNSNTSNNNHGID